MFCISLLEQNVRNHCQFKTNLLRVYMRDDAILGRNCGTSRRLFCCAAATWRKTEVNVVITDCWCVCSGTPYASASEREKEGGRERERVISSHNIQPVRQGLQIQENGFHVRISHLPNLQSVAPCVQARLDVDTDTLWPVENHCQSQSFTATNDNKNVGEVN